MTLLKSLVEKAKRRTAIEMGWLYASLPASRRPELLNDLAKVDIPITFNIDLIAPDKGIGDDVGWLECRYERSKAVNS